MKAILLINIGSPMDLKISSIRKYLREFLSDDSVLDFPKILQFILVNFIIVPFRSPKTKIAYEQIWTDQGSPLIINTRSLAQKLSKNINIPVEVAMRYQEPSIKDGLNNLLDKGCKEILAVPLYPQYSQSTSLSTKVSFSKTFRLSFFELMLRFETFRRGSKTKRQAYCEVEKKNEPLYFLDIFISYKS